MALEKNLLEIQEFNDEQISFYRDNESTYYHKILDIINFIKNNEIKTLTHYFKDKKDLIKDFKVLFLELTQNNEYNRSSEKKSNFFQTINQLTEIVKDYYTNKDREIISVTQQLEKYQKEFSEIKNTLDAYQETFNIFNKRIKEKEDYFEEKNKEVLKIKENAENAENAFKENHKLHEAKKYWANKRFWHSIKSGVLFTFFLLLIGFLGYKISYKAEETKIQLIHSAPIKVFLDKNNSKLQKKSSVGTSIEKIQTKIELIKYMEYLFLISLIIWISRILLKMTFSNLHLKEEAHEKETMILTYLALINEGAGLRDDDRKLILESIFRSSTNGLIKDESNVTLLDIVKTIKK